MKATLTFDLPTEAGEYALARNGADYYAILTDLDNFCRNQVKYADDKKPVDYTAAMSAVRTHLYDLCEDHNICLDREPR